MGEHGEHHAWTTFPPVLSYIVMSNSFVGQKATEELHFWNRREGVNQALSQQVGQGPQSR